MGNKEEITLRFRDRAQVKKKHGKNYGADQGTNASMYTVGHHVSIATNQYIRRHYQYNDERT